MCCSARKRGEAHLKLFALALPRKNEISARQERVLTDRLSARERRRGRSMDRNRHLEFVIGRALLRYVAAGELGCRREEVEVAVDDFGRPVISGPRGLTRATASLSHDRDHACVAWNPIGRIGVDVTRYSSGADVIARRFFTREEQCLLARVKQPERGLAFASLWATKEAICKARGGGLHFPLAEVDVARVGSGVSGDLNYLVHPLDKRTAVAIAWDGSHPDSSLPLQEMVFHLRFTDVMDLQR